MKNLSEKMRRNLLDMSYAIREYRDEILEKFGHVRQNSANIRRVQLVSIIVGAVGLLLDAFTESAGWFLLVVPMFVLTVLCAVGLYWANKMSLEYEYLLNDLRLEASILFEDHISDYSAMVLVEGILERHPELKVYLR